MLPRIFDRYIGSQIVFSTLFGVGVLSLVLVLGNVFKRVFPLLERGDLPLIYVLKFILYVLPFSLAFTIPWGFLMAVLLLFGRLSADNELLSMRMAGLSMKRICAPVLLLATALVGLCYFINGEVSPRAKSSMQKIFYSLASDNPASLFGEDKVTNEFPGFVFYTGAKDGSSLTDLHLIQVDDNARPLNFILAESVQVEPLPGADAFNMILGDAHLEVIPAETPNDFRQMRHGVFFEEFTTHISLEELKSTARRSKPSAKRNSELREELDTRIDILTGLKLDEAQLSSIRTELNKRKSFSLACLAFCLIGIPLGITAQRQETSVGFALSLVVAFSYFLFISIADNFGDEPDKYPHLMMWIPNVLFITLGLVLFWRLSRR